MQDEQHTKVNGPADISPRQVAAVTVDPPIPVPGVESPLRNLRDAKVMIVDDQEANVYLLKQILTRAGYSRLTGITDPLLVLSAYEEVQPDLILLDLLMPQLDGFGVMEQIRPLVPEGTYLPVLVLTADISPEPKHRALLMGANDFLTKPFDQAEVLLRIGNLLETRRLYLQLQAHNEVLERKVRERTAELARTLGQLLTTQETERRRLAMEIHDGPLQMLGVSTLALNRAVLRQERGEHDIVATELRDLRGYLGSVINDLRSLLFELSLEVLTNHGLVSALREYVARFSRATDVDVVMRGLLDDSENPSNTAGTGAERAEPCDDSGVLAGRLVGDQLPGQVALMVYRLAQEALSNVRKHARADRVELDLVVEQGSVRLTVEDNGKGFDPDAVLRQPSPEGGKHMGLRSMRQRVREARGSLEIRSEPGKGTRLEFWFPLGPV
jgi:putative two-component system response regulator